VNAISKHQFILFRALFGLYLLQFFLRTLAGGTAFFGIEDLPARVATAIPVLLTSLSVLFMAGFGWRICAGMMALGWLGFQHWDFLCADPLQIAPGVLLVFCAFCPPMKQGKFPAALVTAGWVLLAVGYGASGILKSLDPQWRDGTTLLNWLGDAPVPQGLVTSAFPVLLDSLIRAAAWPLALLELAFTILCWNRTTRFQAWLVLAVVQLAMLGCVGLSEPHFGLLMAHLFLFDPRWLPANKANSGLVLYDGQCGLCDRSIRFLLDEGAAEVLRFAPLQGETAKAFPKLASEKRSVVLVLNRGTAGETILLRSDAALGMLDQIGGIWRVMSLLRIIPRPVRDAVYGFIATRRYQWFGRFDACPARPPDVAARFLP
jgi:predicted DCC family thiol-disulfide oxidoreductase YuxK